MFSSGNVKKYIHPIIAIALMLVGFIIPPPAPITEMGIAVVFIFIGMIWGWSTCGMLWPSLLGVIMLGFTGYVATPEAALGLMLTNTTFIASLVGFILFAYINETNLLDVVSTWLVTRKFAAGKPWVFCVFFFFALALVSPFIGNPILLIILGMSFIGPVLAKMGYTKEDAFPTFVMIGVSLCGLSSVYPFFMPSSIYTRGIISTAIGGASLTGLQYTMCIAVPTFLSIALFVLAGKFIARVDTTKFKEGSQALLEAAGEKKISLTADQKRGAIVLLLFSIAMIIPNVLPASWALTQVFSKAGIVGVCVVLTVAIIVLCKEDGEPLTNFSRLVAGVSWDMVCLTGGIMVIAAALISGGTGVIAFLSAIVIPMLSKMSLVGFVVAVCVIMCVVSQFSMNMVLQMVFAPILAPILMGAGYNPMIAVMAVYFGTQWAYLAPSGSMMAAMVFGNTEWVNKKHLYKVCIPWIIMALIMSVIVSLTFPNIFCANLLP
ncbi:MAG: SLC13 family permease [Peptococcaceae bacterium]|nr:SLC13 family permease [Peptococcaceae bacterium]MBO5429605.1 SLC13 family permease [Peptococcaceae bacterium]